MVSSALRTLSLLVTPFTILSTYSLQQMSTIFDTTLDNRLTHVVDEELDGVYKIPAITEQAANIAKIIINNSIRSGTFPTPWKLAKVIQIHKKGAIDNEGKYRPISVMSALSKILEICVGPTRQHTFTTSTM